MKYIASFLLLVLVLLCLQATSAAPQEESETLYIYDADAIIDVTTYYFMALFQYDNTVLNGADDSFITSGKSRPPTVTTKNATNITTASATLNMAYGFMDHSSVQVQFRYKAEGASAWDETGWVAQSDSGTHSFSEPIAGLSSNTTHYFMAQLKYDSAMLNGTENSFTTSSESRAPTVSTKNTTNITAASAALNMAYDFMDYSSVQVQFKYKAEGARGWDETGWVAQSDSGIHSFSESIASLSSNTTHYFMAQLKYDGTVLNGAENSFTTSSESRAQTVSTKNATNITVASATLNMAYDFMDYSSVQVQFRYKAEGASAWNETGWVAQTGSGSHSFSEPIVGLPSNTTHYFMAQLKYGSTVLNGTENSFTTSSEPRPPTVTTENATNITTASATLNMTYDFMDYSSVKAQFRYKAEGASAWTETGWVSQTGSGSHSFSEPIAGLSSNTTHYFMAQLKYDGTVLNGTESSFTTSREPRAPTVTTENATNITTASATLNMTYDFMDYSSVQVQFKYKAEGVSEWDETGWVVQSGSGTHSFSESIVDLSSNKTYYFSAQLKYDGTVLNGTEISFTTSGEPRAPTVTTENATNITSASATQNMTYDFRDYSYVLVQFMYKAEGVSAWNETGWVSKTGSGSHSFSESIAGLSSNMTYYSMAQLKYDGTVLNGTENSFTTSGELRPPTVSTKNATNITTASTTLNMTYDFMDYNSVHVQFRYKAGGASGWDETGWVSQTGSGSHSFSEPIVGLSSNKTYYFMALLKYDSTVLNGTENSFTTSSEPRPPAVTTENATNITVASATLNMTYDFMDYRSVHVQFRYKAEGASVWNETGWVAQSGSGSHSFSEQIADLSSNTTHYSMALLKCDSTVLNGTEVSFSTSGESRPLAKTILIYNADAVIDITASIPPDDTLNSSDAPPQDEVKTILIYNADAVINLTASTPPDDTLNSSDALPQDGVKTILIYDADAVIDITASTPPDDTLNSSDAPPQEEVKTILIYDVDAIINIIVPVVNDVAVTDVYINPPVTSVGQSTAICVTVTNEGSQQEENVSVKAFVDGCQVGSTKYVSLGPGSSDTMTFLWIPSAAKNYSIEGEVGVVSGETDTGDNTKAIEVLVPVIPTPAPIFDEIRDTTEEKSTQLTASETYTFITKWGNAGSGDGAFKYARSIAVDSSGNVYVADSANYRIQKFDSVGTFITKWGTSGSGDGEFDYPEGIAADSSGNVFVADEYNHRIQKFDSVGTFITKWGSAGTGDGEFFRPWGIAVDSSGNVFVTDAHSRIQKFDSGGTFITKWGSSGTPYGIAVDSSGNVFVADTWVNHSIQKFDSDGNFITKWGSYGTGDGEFSYPHDIAVDSSGNVYVADRHNDRIQKFDSDGNFITKWGSWGTGDGEFNEPVGIAVDSSGYVYVADAGNKRIQKFALEQPKPDLTITGGLSDYEPPLQVFFQGSEVHVSVQNPDEYTYIVEYWNDTNNNLELDEDDVWSSQESLISSRTTSESEFDIQIPDLMPLGLYRVKIDGTDYVSNNFYVIFNPLNCGLSEEEIDNYWQSEESGFRDCNWVEGFAYAICTILDLVPGIEMGTPTTLRNHENDMLLIMASCWDEHQHFVISNQHDYMIEHFNTFLNANMDRNPGSKPPSDIIEFIEEIKSGGKPDGDCDCYAVFLVGLARTSGIPARLVIGLGENATGGNWVHGWVEAFYNGGWQVWDPYNSQLACGCYGTNYTGYHNCLILNSELNQLNFVHDEYHVNRGPDYGTPSVSVSGIVTCPVNLHAYDSQGRHVGVNATGGIVLEIPGAYYTGPDSEPEGIVILDQSDNIIFKIEALDAGEFDFTIIQSKDTETTTVTYQNIPITESTEATVDVSEANPTYTMEVDNDGDGVTDVIIEPDYVVTTENPDLIITEKWLCWPDNCTIRYNVTNTGTGTAPACHNTTLYVDGVAVAHDHVPVDLAPGESYIGCFNDYEWGYTPPSDNITVCADNNESIVELNEDNNCLSDIWMCGDVTGDGRVRTSDGRRIFRHLTFGDPIDNMWAADVTGDGRVRTSDGRRIFRHLTFGDPLNCNCSG